MLTQAVFLLEFMESENKIGKYKLYQSKWGRIYLQSNDHRLEPKRLVSEDTGRFCIKRRKEVLKWQNYSTLSAYVVES